MTFGELVYSVDISKNVKFSSFLCVPCSLFLAGIRTLERLTFFVVIQLVQIAVFLAGTGIKGSFWAQFKANTFVVLVTCNVLTFNIDQH